MRLTCPSWPPSPLPSSGRTHCPSAPGPSSPASLFSSPCQSPPSSRVRSLILEPRARELVECGLHGRDVLALAPVNQVQLLAGEVRIAAMNGDVAFFAKQKAIGRVGSDGAEAERNYMVGRCPDHSGLHGSAAYLAMTSLAHGAPPLRSAILEPFRPLSGCPAFPVGSILPAASYVGTFQ